MIDIVHIFKSFDSARALHDVSLRLLKEEALAVVGPSGCGKTTLLRIITGLERPDSGEVKIKGRLMSSFTHMASPSERGISLIFQDLALWPHMTVKENIAFVLQKKGLAGKEREERIEEALEQVALQNHIKRYPHQLSGGERQRLALARGLAPKPDCLLMDEPMSSLDPILKQDLIGLINQLRSIRKMAMVYVSHNMDEVLALADSVAFMDQGKILQHGPKEEIVSHPSHPVIRKFLQS